MIPIHHNSIRLPEYDAFLVCLHARIKLWLWPEKKQAYQKTRSDNVILPDGKVVKVQIVVNKKMRRIAELSYIQGIFAPKFQRYSTFENFVYQKARDMEGSINDWRHIQSQLQTGVSRSNVNYVLDKIFNRWGFDSHDFPKQLLIDDIDTDTCPYCNRAYTKTITYTTDGGKKVIKAELDHFYPRSLYPYLAICYENLVPCCGPCNGTNGKWNQDTIYAMNPFQQHSADDITFSVSFPIEYALDMSKWQTERNVSINIDIKGKDKKYLEKNQTLFHWREIYESHIDYVQELYYKRNLKDKKCFNLSLGKQLSWLTEEQIKRLIVGTYITEKDYGKRPLSKFRTDIARQFGLI